MGVTVKIIENNKNEMKGELEEAELIQLLLIIPKLYLRGISYD